MENVFVHLRTSMWIGSAVGGEVIAGGLGISVFCRGYGSSQMEFEIHFHRDGT